MIAFDPHDARSGDAQIRCAEEAYANEISRNKRVDAGKDVEETEPSGGRRKRNVRAYRKTVPYTYEEALRVAVNALASKSVKSRNGLTADLLTS
jgi:hypothetical protein